MIDLKERTGVKHSTIRLYKHLMKRIIPAIGYMKVTEIRPHHLNNFYKALMEKGVRSQRQRITTRIDLGSYLQEHHVSRSALARQAHVSPTTVTTACRGQAIQIDCAERIAEALHEKLEKLFKGSIHLEPLSNKTIKEYHRFIRVVLAQAEREMIVPYNAASRATPPKVVRKAVNYFQPDEIATILNALEGEPLKWRTITHMLIVTGCRRGEIMGLKWEKIDWENRRVKIDSNLLYSKERGLYEDTTKTGNIRYIQLADETLRLLRKYRAEQNRLRLLNGDRWQDTGFVFTRDNGLPMHPGSIGSWLNKFSERHNLPHINPHAFRHTAASVLIAGGIDIVTVAKMLGHSQVSTTDNIYAHIIEEERSKAGECLAEVILRRKRS
ncbi:MAG: tyrosine-type recombinase/integrase [Butyricicoccus sp.]|nr:tyrosine-type recombinase/integrase [Butyricicoccus sp.]